MTTLERAEMQWQALALLTQFSERAQTDGRTAVVLLIARHAYRMGAALGDLLHTKEKLE